MCATWTPRSKADDDIWVADDGFVEGADKVDRERWALGSSCIYCGNEKPVETDKMALERYLDHRRRYGAPV